jgi:AcrR family transcriptional regulator
VTAEPVRIERRQRRRLETIEEIVDVAVQVMTEYGVGGLSLGEVARRMGIRTPSLYVYFDSKNAVYDAVFARGWREVHAVMESSYAKVDEAADLAAFFLADSRRFVGWMLTNPVYAQLMCWRVVPGYEPSEAAYGAAVEMLAASQVMFERLQARGLFRSDLDAELLLRNWTVVTSGVMTQQLANAPHESFDDGRFTSALPDLVEMFLTRYGAPSPRQRKGKP